MAENVKVISHSLYSRDDQPIFCSYDSCLSSVIRVSSHRQSKSHEDKRLIKLNSSEEPGSEHSMCLSVCPAVTAAVEDERRHHRLMVRSEGSVYFTIFEQIVLLLQYITKDQLCKYQSKSS